MRGTIEMRLGVTLSRVSQTTPVHAQPCVVAPCASRASASANQASRTCRANSWNSGWWGAARAGRCGVTLSVRRHRSLAALSSAARRCRPFSTCRKLMVGRVAEGPLVVRTAEQTAEADWEQRLSFAARCCRPLSTCSADARGGQVPAGECWRQQRIRQKWEASRVCYSPRNPFKGRTTDTSPRPTSAASRSSRVSLKASELRV